MVKLHAPHTLEDAYQKALEVEKFNKPSSFAHTCQSMSSNGNTRPNNIRSQESRCNTPNNFFKLFFFSWNLSFRCFMVHHEFIIIFRNYFSIKWNFRKIYPIRSNSEQL